MKKGVIITIAVLVILAVLAAAAFAAFVAFGVINRNKNHEPRPSSHPVQVQESVSPKKDETPKTDTSTETTEHIGEEKVKEIVLEKAGLSAEDVSFVKVKLDFDDGIWKYEVEFRNGATEYEAEVKADDGTVLEWDVDYRD